MIIERDIYDDGGGKVLFQLRLFTGHKNRLYSNLPPPLMFKYFQSELFHLKNALIINPAQANRLLEALEQKILQKEEMMPFFYPEYLTSSDLRIGAFDRIVWLQHKFNFRPGLVFAPKLCPVEFYFSEQIYKMGKTQIFKSGNPILYEAFKAKYLSTSLVQEAFLKSANENDIFLDMEGDEAFDYVLVLSEVGSLKMFISI